MINWIDPREKKRVPYISIDSLGRIYLPEMACEYLRVSLDDKIELYIGIDRSDKSKLFIGTPGTLREKPQLPPYRFDKRRYSNGKKIMEQLGLDKGDLPVKFNASNSFDTTGIFVFELETE